MTLEDFVKLDPKNIRKDNKLMRLFVDFYKAAFSVTPNCAGCVFQSGFKRLKKYAENSDKNTNFENMKTTEKKTFRLKSKYRLKILSYRKEGKVFRSYGYNMTESFAKELAEHGDPKVFDKKPDETKELAEHGDPKASKYESMDYRAEVLPLYGELKEKTGKKADSNKKTDIIKFLEENND